MISGETGREAMLFFVFLLVVAMLLVSKSWDYMLLKT